MPSHANLIRQTTSAMTMSLLLTHGTNWFYASPWSRLLCLAGLGDFSWATPSHFPALPSLQSTTHTTHKRTRTHIFKNYHRILYWWPGPPASYVPRSLDEGNRIRLHRHHQFASTFALEQSTDAGWKRRYCSGVKFLQVNPNTYRSWFRSISNRVNLYLYVICSKLDSSTSFTFGTGHIRWCTVQRPMPNVTLEIFS